MEAIVGIFEKNWQGFLMGALMTMLVALLGTIFGSVIGLMIGVVRTIPVKKPSKKAASAMVVPKKGFKAIVKALSLRLRFFFVNIFIPYAKYFLQKAINTILTVYIEVFRGTPMIIQSVVIFYGFAEWFNWHMDVVFAGILIVSINTGAYMSEIVRGGINAIDKGQFEAAHAIGMSHRQTMFNIILPQTIRNILPATSNEFVINIKDTAVLNVIGLSELFFKTKGIWGKNYLFYQTAIIACVIYFILTFITTRALRLLEKKFRGSESYTLQDSRTRHRRGI